MIVRCKLLHPDARVPYYQSAWAAGMDLCAHTEAPSFVVHARQRVLVPTGIALEIPYGYEGQIRPRSGLAAKRGLTVLNAPGTIDADFRGEVAVLLVNLGIDPVLVVRGDRIAQLVIAPVTRALLELADDLSPTTRGAGGFGSTGL